MEKGFQYFLAVFWRKVKREYPYLYFTMNSSDSSRKNEMVQNKVNITIENIDAKKQPTLGFLLMRLFERG